MFDDVTIFGECQLQTPHPEIDTSSPTDLSATATT